MKTQRRVQVVESALASARLETLVETRRLVRIPRAECDSIALVLEARSPRSRLPVAIRCEVCLAMTRREEMETHQEEESIDGDCRDRQV
jgi:hypothetical protein